MKIPRIPGWAPVPPEMRGEPADSRTDVLMNPALNAAVYIDADHTPAMAPMLAATAYANVQKERHPEATYGDVTQGLNGHAAAFTMEEGEGAGLIVVRRATVRPDSNIVFQGTWPKASAELAKGDFMLFAAVTEMRLIRVSLLERDSPPWIPIPSAVAGVAPTARALAHAKYMERAQITVELIHPMTKSFDEYVQMMQARMPSLTRGPTGLDPENDAVHYEVTDEAQGWAGKVTLRRIEGASDGPSLAVVLGSWEEDIVDGATRDFDEYVRALSIEETEGTPVKLGQPQPLQLPQSP